MLRPPRSDTLPRAGCEPPRADHRYRLGPAIRCLLPARIVRAQADPESGRLMRRAPFWVAVAPCVSENATRSRPVKARLHAGQDNLPGRCWPVIFPTCFYFAANISGGCSTLLKLGGAAPPLARLAQDVHRRREKPLARSGDEIAGGGFDRYLRTTWPLLQQRKVLARCGHHRGFRISVSNKGTYCGARYVIARPRSGR